jgi:hypothetical protein
MADYYKLIVSILVGACLLCAEIQAETGGTCVYHKTVITQACSLQQLGEHVERNWFDGPEVPSIAVDVSGRAVS